MTRVIVPPAHVPRPLPPWSESVLRDGTWDRRYKSRQAATLAVFVSMLNQGWTWKDAHVALSDPDCGMRAEILPDLREARRLWLKAESFVQENPSVETRNEALQVLGELYSELNGITFPGRTGVRDRLVLEAVHQIATRHKTLTPALGRRTLAEMTGIGQETCSRALHSLIERGWLTPVSRSRDTRAAVYRLTKPMQVCTSEPLPSPRSRPTACGSSVHTTAVQIASSDVGRSLGRSAALLYAALTVTDVCTVPELVHTTGLARRTVHKHLRVLLEEGLAAKDTGGYLRVEADLEALAEVMGVAGKAEQVKAEHARQRENWQQASERTRKIARLATIRNRTDTLRNTLSESIKPDLRKQRKTRRSGRKHRRVTPQTA